MTSRSTVWRLGICALLPLTLAGCFLKNRPASGPPAPPTASCSVQPTEVLAGERVSSTATVSNLNPRHEFVYTWNSTGGRVSSNQGNATIDTTGLAPGIYIITANIADTRAPGRAIASCSSRFSVNEALKNPPTVSLVADRRFVIPGRPATFTATCVSQDTSPVAISQWTASAGTIVGNGNTATLDTGGLPPGPITVSVICSSARGLTASATAEVILSYPKAAAKPPPPPPQIKDTGRAFLLPSDTEQDGYGMYSYLLWWDNPSPNDRDRFVTIVAAFLRLPTIAALEGSKKVMSSSGKFVAPVASIPKEQLNVAYVPVTELPPDNPTADWVVYHYDLARAHVLLANLGRKYQSGPYIVSTLAPLTPGLPSDAHYLFQNLSSRVVTPELAQGWIKQFQDQAQSQQFWKADKMRDFVLTLRAQVAKLAVQIPDARRGLATWISWLSPPKPE